MKNNKKECTNQYSETELGLMASCLVFIWDILKWLVLEWKLEENQTIFGLVVAKSGPFLVHDNGKSSNQLKELKWNRVKADYKGEAFRPDLKNLHRLSRSLVANGQSEHQKALKNST
ncbi:MAG: hypothetical protein H3C47_02125 [Candidatus Cloacimonetes bacterium]|nr:hypothetical protein [Candidatus Cloacimonadota bacterium]